jgi:sporulation protein YlmC with PRC-barrel domain
MRPGTRLAQSRAHFTFGEIKMMRTQRSLKPLAAALLVIGSNLAMAQSPTSPPATSAADKRANVPANTAPGAVSEHRSTSYSGMKDSKAWERTHRASKIIGMDVVNGKGEKVGDVEDIVLDSKGNVAYAVVSTGGFLGVGDRLHAIPWTSLRTHTGKDNFMLDVDRERLKGAPGFDQSNWPDVNDPKWSDENRRYFSPVTKTSQSGVK